MYLTRHLTADGPRWALDDRFLPPALGLGLLLQLPRSALPAFLQAIPRTEPASGKLLAPLEPAQEVWACGVTYLRSREAREAESTVKDVYARVYEAKRPELFWKAIGWRVVRSPDADSRARRQCLERSRTRADPGGERRRRDRRLLRGQRRVVARHRGRKSPLPAAGQGVQRLLRARAGDLAGDVRDAERSVDPDRDLARRANASSRAPRAPRRSSAPSRSWWSTWGWSSIFGRAPS